MNPFAIEPLESRLFLSAAPSSETNIGSFSRNRSVTVKQLVDSSNTTHTFKFSISGNTAKIVTFKINKPKHTSFQFDLSDSHGDYGSPRQIILGAGTYSVSVDADGSASKYSLNVRSSNAVRNAKTAKPKPLLTASIPLTTTIPWLDAPILSMPTLHALDPGTLAISYFDPTTLAQGEPQLTGVTIRSGIILSNPTYSDSGTGMLTLENSSETTASGETSNPGSVSGRIGELTGGTLTVNTGSSITLGGGTLSIASNTFTSGTLTIGPGATLNVNGTGEISSTIIGWRDWNLGGGALSDANGYITLGQGTLSLGYGSINFTKQGTGTLVLGTVTLAPGTTLTINSPTFDFTAHGLNLATMTISQGAAIVLQQPTDDQLSAIRSNGNLQLTQNDDGSWRITAAAPVDTSSNNQGTTGTSSDDVAVNTSSSQPANDTSTTSDSSTTDPDTQPVANS